MLAAAGIEIGASRNRTALTLVRNLASARGVGSHLIRHKPPGARQPQVGVLMPGYLAAVWPFLKLTGRKQRSARSRSRAWRTTDRSTEPALERPSRASSELVCAAKITSRASCDRPSP